MSSQVIDTAIFTLVVWAPIVGIRYALALVIAMIDTAFIYWAKRSFLQQQVA